MRHLEKLQMDSSISELHHKQDLFESLPEIKEEIPNFVLDENFMKNDFTSDEDSLIGANLHLNIKNDSDSSEDLYSPLKNEVRKNRRKASAPQRAVQLELSHSGSIGNSSESSQDNIDNLKFTNIQNLGVSFELENEVGLDFVEGDDLGDDLLEDISEDDIFKDLQEEADGETIDEEIIDNVKEEWRAHWGVKCNMCEQVFPFKTEFDKHYISTYNLNPVYTCTFCNKSAEKYSTFRSHCYRHITEGRYKCQECPKGFSLQSMLHVHVLAKHTKAKPFMCEECGKSFVTKPGLKIHLKKHKTETKEDYPCVECGKVLHTRGGLTSHMNVHRLGRRFMCDVCGKTFTQKVNMQQHVKQHTGDKPHSCDKCGKTFAEKSHLARHYSFHSEERPYKCEVCQKMYKTERCLKVHSLVHAAARPFVCGYCNKGFLSSTKLKQHYNIHTGERPYKCKYCERTFTNYPNWLKHTRRRHKVDHKTGAELEPKTPKEEAPATPAPPIDQAPLSETSTIDPLLSDVNLTKAEELLLQQGLLNFPLLDDKIIFNQPIDFFTANTNSSVGLLVPYFQTALPNHQTIIQHTTQTWEPYHKNTECRLLASSSKDGDVKIWDTVLCNTVFTISGHLKSVTVVKWGGSGLIYTASQDRTVKVWRAKDGILCRTLEGHAHWVNTLALSTDYILRIGAFDPVKDSHKDTAIADKKKSQEFALKRFYDVTEAHGERLVSGSDDFTLFLWDPERDKKPLARLTGHQQLVNDVKFSPDGRILASASFDKSIRLWESKTGKFICTLRGHVQAVYMMAFSADSRLMVSGSADSTLKLWNLKTKKLEIDLPGHADEIYAVDWSTDGLKVASGGKDKVLRLWQN